MLCFFFNDTATAKIYTLSLHDALPISRHLHVQKDQVGPEVGVDGDRLPARRGHADLQVFVLEHLLERLADARLVVHDENPIDRKSTRLNSSHANISYAVFCLKKKNNIS